MSNQIHEIPLAEIRAAHWNPASRLDPDKVKELADSIKKEGQKSAALVRPVEAEAPVKYELVFGHRRFAAQKLLSDNNGHNGTLRAEIEEMDEAQAMIISGIENLQRQDFSDYEEAKFIQACAGQYGNSAVKILSERLSVSQPYIRKRLEILKLPQAALELWESGAWHVGHMEQLLRIGNNEEVAAFLEEIFQHGRGPEDWPVYELKEQVERQAVSFKKAFFDKKECKSCRHSTDCQRRLFGTETEKGYCLNPQCFFEKQQAWLDVNWSSCKANKYGTNAAIIGDYDTKVTGKFCTYDSEAEPSEKCLECAKFTSILRLNGEPYYGKEKVCMGEAQCFAEVKRASKKKGGSGKDKTEEVDPEAPRVPWHGEYFRQQFYQDQIPLLIARLEHDDPRRVQVALATVVHSARNIHEWFWAMLGNKMPEGAMEYHTFRLSFSHLLALAKTWTIEECEYLMAEVAAQIALLRDRGAYGTDFMDEDRQTLTQFLDIDWSRFQVNEEYLNKKTKAEVVKFIVHESGLMKEPEFLTYLRARGWFEGGPEKLAQLKKGILVDLVLKCGVDLHGRLPKEIANLPNLSHTQEA